MDWSFWLQTVANISQVVGVLWTLLLGGISVRDAIARFLPKAPMSPTRKYVSPPRRMSFIFIFSGMLVSLFIGIFLRPVLIPIHTPLPTLHISNGGIAPSSARGTTFYTLDNINAAAWSPNGKYIALATDNTVRICDASNGATLSLYKGQANVASIGSINIVAWSPDSKRIASVENDTYYNRNSVTIWDATTKEVINTFANYYQVTSLAWSPDGTRIATVSSNGVVQSWNTADSTKVYTYGNQSFLPQSVSWSPDGKYIAVGGGAPNQGHVEIFDAETQQSIFAQDVADVVNAVAWSPDSNFIATSSQDTTVVVWNVKTSEATYTYKAHNGGVHSVAWSPDGSRIASGAGDMTVKIWNATDGGDTYTYNKFTKAVIYVAWSPDGERIASLDSASHLVVWQAT